MINSSDYLLEIVPEMVRLDRVLTRNQPAAVNQMVCDYDKIRHGNVIE